MTKRRLFTIIEILCAAILIGFVVILCVTRSSGTQKELGEVAEPVINSIDESQMTKKSNAVAAKTFKFDLSKTEDVLYYSNDNIMDVTELLMIKFKNEEDAGEFETAVRSRVENQKNLYKSYAPEQYALLNDCIIKVNGNTLFYCTAKNANQLYETFRTSL